MNYYQELFNIIDTNNDGYITYNDILKCNYYKNDNHLIKYKTFIQNTIEKKININDFIKIYEDNFLSIKELEEIFILLKN